jgi:hypothetical protein
MDASYDRLRTMYGLPSRPNAPVWVRKIGTREEVWAGVAERTRGGLRKEDLREKVTRVNPHTGKAYTRLVSLKASEAAQRVAALEGFLRPKQKVSRTGNGEEHA